VGGTLSAVIPTGVSVMQWAAGEASAADMTLVEGAAASPALVTVLCSCTSSGIRSRAAGFSWKKIQLLTLA
jgi:hypothetical protein